MSATPICQRSILLATCWSYPYALSEEIYKLCIDVKLDSSFTLATSELDRAKYILFVPLILFILFALASMFLIIKLRKMAVIITKENPNAGYQETYCVFSLQLLKWLEKLQYVNLALLLVQVVILTVQICGIFSGNCNVVSFY